MPRPTLPHGAVQVAGVVDADESDLLVRCGVEMLGFPLRLRDGREDVSESDAAKIIRKLPMTALGVVITYLDQADQIVDLCDTTGCHWVQLHAPIRIEELHQLRRHRPELGVIKSLVVRGDNLAALCEQSRHCEPLVDAFITDTHDPATNRTGATGLTHDWSVSRALISELNRPVILAGGLTADNVLKAIQTVAPAGVDAHTGLEGTDGRKDETCVRRFVANAKSGFVSGISTRGAVIAKP